MPTIDLKLEPEAGKSFQYKIDGNKVVVAQHTIGDLVFLRLKKDEPQERIDQILTTLSEATKFSKKKVVLLPHSIEFVRPIPSLGLENAANCEVCSGKMRKLSHDESVCLQCGHKGTISATHISRVMDEVKIL